MSVKIPGLMTLVSDNYQVIVAARATNQPSDKGQAVSMIEEATLNTGAVPKELSADASYYSGKAVEELCALGVDPFIAPERTRHGRVLEPAPLGRIPKGLSARDRIRRKLRTKRGRERYALRMETVEPEFGQIKRVAVSGSSCCGAWRFLLNLSAFTNPPCLWMAFSG